MKALTAAEMREVDRLTTECFDIPSLELMESAGIHVADACLRHFGDPPGRLRTFCVLCGKGNNGGDGFVAARYLQKAAASVRVYLFARADELRGDAAANFRRWSEAGGEVTTVSDEAAWKSVWGEIAGADVIVDAIFGTGFRGVATGAILQAIADINQLSQGGTAARPALILAVDTPSGLGADGGAAEGPVLRAHRTVTFTAPKPGQLISREASAVGHLEVVDIGSPATLVDEIGQGSLRWIEPQEFAGLPLVRPVDSHKGLYGHVLLVAGSQGKSGAAIMAGHAALRAGAGLVTVATPDVVLPEVAAAHPEYMTEPLLATDVGTTSEKSLEDDRFARMIKGKTVLAFGPGLGQHPETQTFLRKVIQQTELPTILDADGLNAFDGCSDALRQRKTQFLAITPHPGEMARLVNTSTKAVQEDRVRVAQEAAKRWNVFVVLKGSHTVLAAPNGTVFINTTGNAGLAKGGSGDVLTGMLAALTAQFKTENWVKVLALGVYLHGLAAEIAAEGMDLSGLLAGDVVNAIPKARQKLLWELQRRG
jgi:ADP-dependent NAD(P)H-hydrate dehydratase / NAD(P)H-hydrate epimerase